MLRSLFLVGIGGAVGSIARYGLSLSINTKFSSSLPLGTLIVNIIGCFIIGILFGLAAKQQWTNNDILMLVGTGFCGGFTTFSTFALENISLFDKQQTSSAIVYTIVSLILGIGLCKLGFLLGDKL
jgi:CrcB protein